jgi:hypothetical protein
MSVSAMIAGQWGATDYIGKLAAALLETPQQRFQRFQLNWAYYMNQQYDATIRNALSGQGARRAGEVLYHKIKPLFNICNQAASLDAAAILADAVVTSTEPRWEQGIVEVWKRSALQSKLQRLLLYGSVYGTAFLRLANETTAPQIVIHPPTEFDISVDPHQPDKILDATLSYNFFLDRAQRTYTLRIYPDHYETTLDGKPYDYDGRGNSWANPLGFVPVVALRLLDLGDVYGQCTFYSVLPQLDAVNEIASQMAEIVRIHSEPQLVAKNVKKGNLSKGHDDKGATTVWYVNTAPGSTAEPDIKLLEWSGNIQGAVEFIDWCKGNVEEAMPEWHLKRIREQSTPSGYSVALQLTELQIKLAGMRRNAVESLRQIDGMAMVAQGQAPSITDVSHDIKCGSILPKDMVSEAALVYTDLQNGLIDRQEALKRRGYDSQEVKEILARVDKEREARLLEGAAWPDTNPTDTGGAVAPEVVNDAQPTNA